MKSKRGNILFTVDKLLQWKILIREKDFKLLIGVEIPSKHLRFLSFEIHQYVFDTLGENPVDTSN